MKTKLADNKTKVKKPLRRRLIILAAGTTVPFVLIILYMVYSLINYGNAYNSIVSNLTVANSYNLTFKEQMDESVYRIIVGRDEFGSGEEDDPYVLVDNIRNDFTRLKAITTEVNSRTWLETLLRNVDTLNDRLDDIRVSVEAGGHYDEDVEMLDSNIYSLTGLIQDNIQYYIYYQTKTIEVINRGLSKEMEELLVVLVLLLVLGILCTIITTDKVARSIVQPIETLGTATKEIAEGNFSVRTSFELEDEISVLSESVDDMAAHLEIQMEQIREDEKKMRMAEAKLLQEQINPHFLYNTLDTIVWLIEDGKSQEAEDMVVSLSKFFRISLSHGKDFITIREEEQHIRSYLEIQRVRYSDILSYYIDIDDKLYNYKILKMTLQPLVENALYHGIKNKRGAGLIRITGREVDGLVRFEVSDDGVGMDEEMLLHLRKEINKPAKDTDTGFGMANVNERIKMNFGDRYGISIESEPDMGTKVSVVLPALPYYNEEEKNGDK
ncbi:sensor histidine kinase [Butyrivibrio sp. X503]|uniref:sensor histidine kinase n=1 Tax=Butyrivibrio sp. X503 TaxID=2364878 RepID=UPI000EA9F103|nr:sensor histidine kinase [Butyrivibrio sp. X503]RKM54975.1 sensor histidine kinase [Butyrivibrio sp. X503]